MPDASACCSTGGRRSAASRAAAARRRCCLVVNAHHDVVVFTLPEVTGGRDWVRLIDTNLPEEDDDPEEPTRLAFGHSYEVTGRSLLLFLLRPVRAARPTQARAPGALATPAAE